MKLLKQISYGALLWVLIFFEVSILMFGFGLEDGLSYYITHYLLAIFLVALVTALYFRKENSNFIKGIKIGIIFAITGIILDLAITVPLFVKDYTLMFGDIGLWIGIVLGIITAGVVGAVKNK
tara:strand:- start:260 stop:628 length:369 start_codon:yes stop_codon:yes gene_type:complete